MDIKISNDVKENKYLRAQLITVEVPKQISIFVLAFQPKISDIRDIDEID